MTSKSLTLQSDTTTSNSKLRCRSAVDFLKSLSTARYQRRETSTRERCHWRNVALQPWLDKSVIQRSWTSQPPRPPSLARSPFPTLCLPSLGMAMRVIVGVYVACRLWPTPVGLQEFCAKVSKLNGKQSGKFGKPALVSAAPQAEWVVATVCSQGSLHRKKCQN